MTPLLGACFGGTGFGQTVARASRSWVHDIKVETLAQCGAGWQPARRLAPAAVRCQRGIWPIDNRPQLAKLPHKSPRCFAYTYARIQAVLLMNRLGVHFCVAHPLTDHKLTDHKRRWSILRRGGGEGIEHRHYGVHAGHGEDAFDS